MQILARISTKGEKMNKDWVERDRLIFGSCDPDKYFGGLRRFTATKELIVKLLENDFIDRTSTQNHSPSVEMFLEYADNLENSEISFICYAISGDRPDYGVIIEGIDAVIPDNKYDDISIAVEVFRGADEFSFEHARCAFYLRAWWD